MVREWDGGWLEPRILTSEKLRSRHGEFIAATRWAERRLRAFAREHAWETFVREPFAKALEVVDDREAYACRLREICGVGEDFEVPATYSGALEGGVLLAKTPELFASDYAEGREENAWAKLICHEMAHRLHVRILDGDEKAMGPIWFFEGFALVAAGQFEADGPEDDLDVVAAVLSSRERGSYRRYAGVLRRLLVTHDLKTLVRRAGERGFSEEILQGMDGDGA